jgi:hypothetical protein
MKLHGPISINGRPYSAGMEVPWTFIYPFFLIHMAAFGGSGFLMAYAFDAPPEVLFMHGGIAIFVYLVFYLAIFGLDEVKWMFINTGLGLFGIVSQIDWILSLFGKRVGDYPISVHVIPFLYFVLYTFLIRHAVVDFFGAREDEAKRRRVEYGYVGTLLAVFSISHLLGA